MAPETMKNAGEPAMGTPGSLLSTASRSPLLLDEWIEYNRRRWRVTPERVVLGKPDGTPRLETVYYRLRSGKIWRPPRTIYQPVAFQTSPDTGVHRAYTQWLDLSQELAAQMARTGIRHSLVLGPEVSDVRAWRWQGLLIDIRYTFLQDFPYSLAQANQSVRSRIKKAQKAGYTCRRSDSVADVSACLAETEGRSGFDHRYSTNDLASALRVVGPDHFRCYSAYAPSGEPAASYVVLHNEGGHALAWLISTRTKHLPSGVTQLLHHYITQDLEDAGAAGFDLVGATLPSVAAAKSGWAPRLVPCYFVQQYTPRRIAAFAYRGARDMSARFRARLLRPAAPDGPRVTARGSAPLAPAHRRPAPLLPP